MFIEEQIRTLAHFEQFDPIQFNGKTSTKRSNSSASSYGAETQKKTRLVSQTPRLILPKPVLTEPQAQNILLQPQQQQQSVLSELPQQQQRSQLQKQQQRVFFSQHPSLQEQYVFQQPYDPQLYNLSPTLIELNENYDETYLISDDDKISQPKKTNIPKQSHAKKKDDDDKDQDPDEKSGWKNSEIEILLDYLQENFTSWSKGNKTKFYNDMAKNILTNKEAIAIKSKLTRLIKKYESVKKHNNQSGVERKDWEWYDKLDIIFGTHENISPSFLANKSTDTDIISEEVETKKVNNKKQKNKNNVEVMTTAIAEMSQSRERIWKQKMTLEKEKLDRSHELEKERLKIEQERLAYERERERERMKMEFDLKVKELELKYQKKD